MSREKNIDFENFVAFLKNYKLADIFENEKVVGDLKRIHKKYYSYLTLISELEPSIDDINYDSILTELQFSYLVESSSDVLSSVFHSINGSYKSARVMLRSSIETFLKGFCLPDIDGILEEKRVYVVFDSIKQLDYFSVEPQKSLLSLILSEYGELCKDTHTARVINMQKLTAFKYFPTYDSTQMNSTSNVILRLIPAYLFLICNRLNSHFQKMHHRNKEIIVDSVKKEFRPILFTNVNNTK